MGRLGLDAQYYICCSCIAPVGVKLMNGEIRLLYMTKPWSNNWNEYEFLFIFLESEKLSLYYESSIMLASNLCARNIVFGEGSCWKWNYCTNSFLHADLWSMILLGMPLERLSLEISLVRIFNYCFQPSSIISLFSLYWGMSNIYDIRFPNATSFPPWATICVFTPDKYSLHSCFSHFLDCSIDDWWWYK